MRFEVIFRQEPLGQQVSCIVTAGSFDSAAIIAANELRASGYVGEDDGLLYPVQIRRIGR